MTAERYTPEERLEHKSNAVIGILFSGACVALLVSLDTANPSLAHGLGGLALGLVSCALDTRVSSEEPGVVWRVFRMVLAAGAGFLVVSLTLRTGAPNETGAILSAFLGLFVGYTLAWIYASGRW